MLRLSWRSTSVPPRLLSEDDFIRELEPLSEQAFAGAPAGALVVEGLDAAGRVAWTGHYRGADGLRTLLRQLVAERAASQRARARSAAREESGT